MNEDDIDSTFPDINRHVHDPTRLKLMAKLYELKSADFLFLMHRTGLTHGNPSLHLSKLEAAGYIELNKTSPYL